MNKITAFLKKLTQKRVHSDVPVGYKSKIVRYIAMLCAVLFCLAIATVYHSSFEAAEGRNESIAYPLEKDITKYNPYVQQFDAFKKGQMHIDYEPTQKFLKVENPYDPDAREGCKEASTFWDRAYFDGKFYSYFGITPIIAVMYPAQALTGMIPSDTAIQLIFMLIFAVFMPLAVYALGEKIAKRTNPFIIATVSAVATLSALQFLFARGRTPFYYIAASCALAFLAMFAFFFIKGIFANKAYARCIYFAVAGLAFALCMHARINTAFTAAFAILPALIFGIILKKRTDKEETCEGETIGFFKKYRVGEIICELASLAFFVIIGMIVFFIMNYVRFGSIFDFGAKYQLTVADVSLYELNIMELPNSIFHYFLAPFKIEEDTGIMNLAYWKISYMNRAVYVDAHFGLLNIPFNLFALFIPFVIADKKRSISFKVISVCALVGCFVSAWIDYCLGGVIYRYLCDFSLIWAMLAAVGIFVIFDMLSQTRLIVDITVSAVIILFMLASALFTFDVMAITNANLLEMNTESFFYNTFGQKDVQITP